MADDEDEDDDEADLGHADVFLSQLDQGLPFLVVTVGDQGLSLKMFQWKMNRTKLKRTFCR
jgi:hypothetical protein